MTSIEEVASWIDRYLSISSFSDDQSLNGLQVEGTRDIGRVATAVDACYDVFNRMNADLLLVHHGLYWKGVSPAIIGHMHSRVSALMDKGVSLYAAHLPLDAHPEVGNNVEIIRAMGMEPLETDDPILWRAEGEFSEVLKAARRIAEPRMVLEFGDSSDFYVCSGGGTKRIFDLPSGTTFLTGEFLHYGYHYAKENKVNVISLGHYETEKFGVQALGRKMREKFGFKTEFIESPTGL